MSDKPIDLTLLQKSLQESQKYSALLEEKIEQDSDMEQKNSVRIADSDARIPKLEGMIDVLKLFPSFLLAALALTFTVMVALLGYVATQVASVERRVEGINGRLSEEFRAMRTDLNSQTSAISNAITATRQAQPQILVIPAPENTPRHPQ